MQDMFYDSMRNCVYDVHGKTYEIKERAGRRWINKDYKQVNIKTLKERFLIRNFDDFVFLYIFYLHVKFPCPAMGFYVHKREHNPKITLQQYFKTHAA